MEVDADRDEDKEQEMRAAIRRLVVMTAILGLGLSIAGSAWARPKIPPRPSAMDCLLLDTDGTYKWVGTGYVVGNYVCIAGKWYNYIASYQVSVNDVTIDEFGGVKADDFTVYSPASEVTLGELGGLAGAVSGGKVGPVDRVVIVADSGRVLTEDETRLLLAGGRLDGVDVLGTLTQPSDKLSLSDLTRKLDRVQILLQWRGSPQTIGTVVW